ncbi:hypothetical protein L218DRAFT_1082099 [Marasmius fiardii PR-910]|nr:hypothetical protein L218DRAFT_1082099 [Marasmius fiardii PR-910]
MQFLFFALLLIVSPIFANSVDVNDGLNSGFQNQCPCTVNDGGSERVIDLHKREVEQDSKYCRRSFGLERRADGDDGTGNGGVGVGVNLPSVGLSLGNITTKLGNINLTVTNVTIALGNVDVENVSVGNISIIVSVPLPGASPVQAFSAFSSSTSIATSTATGTSTVSSTSTTQTATSSGFLRQRLGRQDSGEGGTTASTSPPIVSLPTVTATVGGGPVSLDTGRIDTEIGNISILVGHVNVSVGDVKIKNITLGNIFVLVQIGQPDLTGALGNLTNTLNGIGDR